MLGRSPWKGEIYAKQFELSIKARNRLAIATLVGVLGAIFIITIIATRTENQYVKRLSSIFNPEDANNKGRLKTWALTVDMIKDHPLTGVGAGNWQLNMPKYYRGRYSEEDELNWIRPHNDFLWVAAQKGIPGLIIFLIPFGLAFFYLIQAFKAGSSTDKIMALVMSGSIFGYLTASFFDFPYERIYHQAYLSMYFMVAITLFVGSKPVSGVNIRPVVVYVPFLLAVVFLLRYSISVITQERNISLAREDAAKQDWPAMLEHAKKSYSIFKDYDPLMNPVSNYEGMARFNTGDISGALTAYQYSQILYPDNMDVLYNLALVYQANKQPKLAMAFLHLGLRIIPGHSKFLKKLADIAYETGDYQTAFQALGMIKNWYLDSALVQNRRLLQTKF